MKRKLSGSEASSPGGNDGRGDAAWQARASSELYLEQSAVPDDVRGVILPSHLARSLGMSPGDRIFRGMFYGTPQAPLISSLAAQLLDEHEVLVSRALGEGTSSATQSSDGGYGSGSALMAFNEIVIRALLDSIEAPRPRSIEVPQLKVVPPVVVEDSDTTHWQAPVTSAPEAAQVTDTAYWQAPIAPEQSTVGSCGGFVLAPDLALELGMYSGQVLRRSMFYGTSNFGVVLNMVSQLSAVRESLLVSQELERSIATQEGVTTNTDFQGTASLIATNDELIKALIGSIEAPAVAVPTMAVEEFATELGEKLPKKLEEERNREFAKSKVELYTKEKEKIERKKEEVKNRGMISSKSRAEELKVSLGLSVCREMELKRVKIKIKEAVRIIVVNMEMTSLLGLRKKVMEVLDMIEVYGELRRVVVGPVPGHLQEMEKELEKVRERCRELNQAGEGEVAGGAATEMDELTTRETNLREDIRRAMVREEREHCLEKELGMLVAKELDLEEKSTNEEELVRVRAMKTEIKAYLEAVRATIARRGKSLGLKMKLDGLIVKKKETEARIDMGIREIEIGRLRNKAKAESSDRDLSDKELSLMLRLEGTKVRIRELELELGLWLGKMEERKKEIRNRIISLELDRGEVARRVEEEEVEMLRALVLGESEVAGAWGGVGNIPTSGVASGVMVMQGLGEERAMAMRIRELELELETSIVLERSGGMEERSGTETMEELELELGVVRVQEQNLGLELDGVRVQELNLDLELDRMRAYVMNIDRWICEGRVTLGATSTEIEARKSRLIELNKSRAIARLKGLELRVGLSKARLKARGLVLALEKLRRVVE
ncbi:hypothetical protein [Candidatus Ichthyocystis hellenicum]|uniref:hypothetical protein n=1 Tax=Candidatus Ichthyocystis hellenicum TaxID=1561003 RepID=UPI000B888754|nr:hypothetical protein [Candidatus Ichthyocystis hellenicum]